MVVAIPLAWAEGDRWTWTNNKRNERAAGRNDRAASVDSGRPERLEDL